MLLCKGIQSNMLGSFCCFLFFFLILCCALPREDFFVCVSLCAAPCHANSFLFKCVSCLFFLFCVAPCHEWTFFCFCFFMCCTLPRKLFSTWMCFLSFFSYFVLRLATKTFFCFCAAPCHENIFCFLFLHCNCPVISFFCYALPILWSPALPVFCNYLKGTR